MTMRKAWTWIGGFGPELMLCAATARIGPARTAWWAVWDGERLHERTYRRRGPVDVSPERIVVPGVLDLVVEPGAPWAVRTGPMWTRKRPTRVHGMALGRPVDLRGLVDESAGRHPRSMSWWWSAGAGELADGRQATWNLVDGLHDGVEESERCVWIDGVPAHVPPQAFHGLAGVGDLRFTPLATRAYKRDLLLIASDYEQPFGTFAGALPLGGELRAGWGVMERHRARW
jgi:hypothetical protein